MSLTHDEEEAVLAQAKAIEARRRQVIIDRHNEVERRLNAGSQFTPDELTYAATARCKHCHAGYAYPKDIGPHGYWRCSTLLLSGLLPDEHHDHDLPFMFWSVKSENQPSACGHTTRPSPPKEPV